MTFRKTSGREAGIRVLVRLAGLFLIALPALAPWLGEVRLAADAQGTVVDRPGLGAGQRNQLGREGRVRPGERRNQLALAGSVPGRS